MNLKYINFYDSKQRNKIKKTYLNSFPRNERFPFWILKYSIKNKRNFLYEVLDYNNKFVGICYIVDCQDSFYLMYLAVDKIMRNKRYGSKILEDLKSKYGIIVLSLKRKKFYLANGFYEKNKYYEDNGVKYELLCTSKDYVITRENLKRRYSNMTNSKIIRYIIGKTFNMDNIKIEE